jgi:hypothetical protein
MAQSEVELDYGDHGRAASQEPVGRHILRAGGSKTVGVSKRDLNPVIDENEMDTSLVWCEIEALRLVIPMLIDDADQADVSVPVHASSAWNSQCEGGVKPGCRNSPAEPWI